MTQIPSFVEIGLFGGSICKIDWDDLNSVSPFSWRKTAQGYAAATIKNSGARVLLMHRLIMAAPTGLLVDHINGDKLDNRRANLRIVSHALNQANRLQLNRNNTSGFRGVQRHRKRGVLTGKWQASIMISGKNKYIGVYTNIEDAVEARRMAELAAWGEVSPTNGQSAVSDSLGKQVDDMRGQP